MWFLLACTAPADDSGSPKDSDAGVDHDGDGYGADDCDDQDAQVHPGATEICNGVDDDCNAKADDADDIYYVDSDADGYGDASTAQVGCAPEGGYSADGSDCDDTENGVNPGATESCNGVDDDCDEEVDEGVGASVWADADGDGYGDPESPGSGCESGAGWASNAEDCDDRSADVHPGAAEVCDLADNDCDEAVDEAGALGESDFYADADGDGYGDPAAPTSACEAPPDHVENALDCDDAVAAINPAAEESCNGADDDCDGETDESGGEGSFYPDADEDGYGDDAAPYVGCEAPEGYVLAGGDCDDRDPSVYPTAEDAWYDGEDSDCDGASDFDADGDGSDSDDFGGDDCDDDSAAVHPGAADPPYDGVDTDCSGGSDYDADGDGYDASAYGGDDCEDDDASVNPGAADVDGSRDWNCDGVLNSMPVAELAISTPRETCTALVLDASASSDPDGDSLSYSWELVAAPAGSALTSADFSDASGESTELNPDVAGDYTVSLVVTDEHGASDEISQGFTVSDRGSNSAPVADAGEDQSASGTVYCTPISYGVSYDCAACSATRFNLDGSASSDADGDELEYSWSIGSGSAAFLGSTTSSTAAVLVDGAVPTYGGSATATVTVRLTVSDCMGATSAYNSVSLDYSCTGS